MNLSYLQQLQANGSPSSLSVGSSAASGGTGRGLSLGETVADQIVARIGTRVDDTGQAKDVAGLRDSLASALDWVRGQYGDDAGAAASGMLLSATADGVTEDSIGDGLLDTLRFIDRNFGTSAGDTAIAQFNAGVNAELNDFFDNGANEIFYAADGGTSAETSGDVSARFLTRALESADAGGTDAVSVTGQLLAQLKGDLDQSAGMTDLAAQLDETYAPSAMTLESALFAYSGNFAPSQPQFTDMTV